MVVDACPNEMKRALASILVLLGASGFPGVAVADAAREPVLAVHPLILVEPQEGQLERFQPILRKALIHTGVRLTEESVVSLALQRMDEADCLGRDACLARLAFESKADHALLVTAAPNAPNLVLSGRVVSREGRIIREIDARSLPRDRSVPVEQELERALNGLIEDLDPPSLPPVAQSAAIAAAMTNTASPTVMPPPPSTNVLRYVSYGVAGLAVASGVAGGLTWSSSAADASRLRERLDASGRIREGDTEALRLQEEIGRKDLTSQILLIGGGVALASAVTLFIVSTPDEPQPKSTVGLSLIPGGGGAAITFSGVLPNP
jgi:hypothetical protein